MASMPKVVWKSSRWSLNGSERLPSAAMPSNQSKRISGRRRKFCQGL
jgi:hypothetical protein